MNSEPKKPRDPRALNAYRHGLTGQIHILTPEDQVAYDNHCQGIRRSLAPSGALETDLAQAIADDRWRLKHAAALQSGIFALGLVRFDEIHPHSEINTVLVQSRVWVVEGKELALLSLYEQRIQRRVEKNMKMIHDLQQVRHAALQKAVEEAELLARLAASKGETYDVEVDFPPAALPPQFDFSLAEIARLAAHKARLTEAKKHFAAPRKPLRRVV